MRRGRFVDESRKSCVCSVCGTVWFSGRRHADTCSAKCRKQKSRGTGPETKRDNPGRAGPETKCDNPRQAETKCDSPPHPWDRVFNEAKCDLSLACVILGIDRGVSFKTAQSAYRKASLLYHPDRGGERVMFMRIASAWSYWVAHATYEK